MSLSERVTSFLERVEVPVVSFVGKKKSGKTTVVTAVIAELSRRGYRVAALKHDAHTFQMDTPGTDSYELKAAGAAVTGISSPEQYALIATTQAEPSLERMVSLIAEPVDIVLTEGYKREAAPKVEVSRRERSTGLVCAEDELVAIMADHQEHGFAVPQFGLGDTEGICDLLEERFLRM